jgi:predicted DCC family thiol-disulfide oxidoreductase YuxK
MEELPDNLILFDGVCKFCNASVNFVIARDKAARYRYAPLQSELGQGLLRRFGLDTESFDTFVYVSGGRAHVKSGAALRVASGLGGAWRLLGLLLAIPAPLRDACYGLVARNRYRWFGKRDACMVPSPEVRARFLA